jgi:hypothetical protein
MRLRIESAVADAKVSAQSHFDRLLLSLDSGHPVPVLDFDSRTHGESFCDFNVCAFIRVLKSQGGHGCSFHGAG